MYDRTMDYLKRRADKKRGMRDHAQHSSSDYGYMGHEYTQDHARRRYDAAMDRARRRRGRPRSSDRTSGQDSHYGVGHYIYNDPTSHEYVPLMHPDYADHDKEYEKDLHEWTERLRSKDRFGEDKYNIIMKARNMGAKFDEYTEEEFYVIYLMMVSDYGQIAKEHHTFILMAKAFLEDDDIAVSPSEKVCKYLYEIVLDD